MVTSRFHIWKFVEIFAFQSAESPSGTTLRLNLQLAKRWLTWSEDGVSVAATARGTYGVIFDISVFSEYNQQDATFQNLFISVRGTTCFRRFFRPSSGAQTCTYSVRYLSDRYCYLLIATLATGSSIGLTNTWRCMCSFELLMMGGKTVWNM